MLLLSLLGCNRFDADRVAVFAPGTPDLEVGIGVASQVAVEHPLFAGVSDLVAGDGVLGVGWDAAADNNDAPEDLVYRIYVAPSPGGQDFSAPDAETTPGATWHELDTLTNGTTLYVVVRAVDLEGNEDPNEREWMATPNPVRYVNVASPGINPDGLTPGTAFNNLTQAAFAVQPLAGVNLYVAQGFYGLNVLVFPGTSVYGGFSADFDLLSRDPEARVTEVTVNSAATIFDVQDTDLLSVIDGFVVSGNQVAATGVKAEEAFVRLTNLEIRDLVNQGIELAAGTIPGTRIAGLVARCTVRRCLGEGILIRGVCDLVLDNNLIVDSAFEGIESQFVLAVAGEESRLVLTRNRISGNGAEGIDLDVAEFSETDPTLSQGGEVRLILRNNEVFDNGLHGVQIDVDFEPEDGVDLRARVDDNLIRSNDGHGVLFDGDAQAFLRLSRNVISANSGHGVLLSGARPGPWCSISHCRILGNSQSAVACEGLLGVEIRHCMIRGNRNGAVAAPVAYVDVVNSILIDNSSAVSVSRIRHCLLDGDPLAVIPGPGVLEGQPAALENHPEETTFFIGTGNGTAALADTTTWFVGDTLEVLDDAVAREVTAVTSSTVSWTPPTAVESGDFVARFPSNNDVLEREGFLFGSIAIDAGDPFELDRDGTRADLGPVGGDTPGNVGVETGLEGSPVLELVSIDPTPGFLTAGRTWQLRFNRPLSNGSWGEARVLRNGQIVDSFSSLLEDELRVAVFQLGPVPAPAFTAGDSIVLELLPGAGPGALERHIELEFTAAAAASDADAMIMGSNDSPPNAQGLSQLPALVSGTVETTADLDYYAVSLEAGQIWNVELLVERLDSPLLGRLSILSGDGATVFSTTNPVASGDPVVPPFVVPATGSYLILVESVDGIGSPDHRYEIGLSQRQ